MASARRAIWRYRLATWTQRPLPDFIIVGAQKSGTTSLFHYLDQHPQLVGASTKEVHFFDGGLDENVDNYKKGQQWYRAHFAIKPKGNRLVRAFEASPLYLFNPLAAKRIHDVVPHAKLIAVLRNPTERAISHYFHEKRRNREPLDIREALGAEEGRLAPALEREDYRSKAFIHYSYKSRGHYAEQLNRYLKHFPKEQMLVLPSDDLFRNPGEILRRIFEFVQVSPDFEVRNLKPRNVGSNRERVDSDVYAELRDHFRPHNEALYKLLGRDYGWDRQFD